jgi:hypothetical protein
MHSNHIPSDNSHIWIICRSNSFCYFWLVFLKGNPIFVHLTIFNHGHFFTWSWCLLRKALCWLLPGAWELLTQDHFLQPKEVETLQKVSASVSLLWVLLRADSFKGKIDMNIYVQSNSNFYAFLFCFGVRQGFELRTSHLQSKCSTIWATTSVHFPLVILQMGSHELFA